MAGGKRSRVQMVINPSPRRQMEKCDGSRRPLSGAAVASLSLSLFLPRLNRLLGCFISFQLWCDKSSWGTIKSAIMSR